MKNTDLIRPAQEKDLDQILEIQGSHSIDHVCVESRSKTGFLVYLMDRETLKKYQTKNNYFLYVYDDNCVQAYIAACSGMEITKDRFKDMIFYDGSYNKFLSEKYLYAKHVAKKKDVQGNFVVSLENTLFQVAKELGYTGVIAEIALSPRNEKSLSFHQDNGFKLIGEYYDSNKDIKWGVLHKNLR